MAKDVLRAQKVREEEIKIKTELKEANGLVEMWTDVNETYQDLKSKLNYGANADSSYLNKLAEAQASIRAHGGRELVDRLEAFAQSSSAANNLEAFKANCPAKAEEEEDFGAALIVNDAQKSKSKGKARQSRSRVFMGGSDEEDKE